MKEQDAAARLKRREPCQDVLDALYQELTRAGEDTAKEVIASSASSLANTTSQSSIFQGKRDTDSASLDDEALLQKAWLSPHGQTSGNQSAEALSDQENKEVQA